MGVETVSGIWDLNILWPLASDDRTTSDDHHRLIKSALLKTFPNLEGTVSVSSTEINNLDGLSVNAQTKLNAIDATITIMSTSIDTLDSQIATISASLNTLDTQVTALKAIDDNTYYGRTESQVTGGVWPSGWALSQISVGVFRVTHSLGSDDRHIVLTYRSTTSNVVRITDQNSTYFDITSTGLSGTAVWVDVDFVLYDY